MVLLESNWTIIVVTTAIVTKEIIWNIQTCDKIVSNGENGDRGISTFGNWNFLYPISEWFQTRGNFAFLFRPWHYHTELIDTYWHRKIDSEESVVRDRQRKRNYVYILKWVFKSFSLFEMYQWSNK